MKKTTLTKEESVLAYDILKSVGVKKISSIETGLGSSIDELLSFMFVCDDYKTIVTFE